MRDDGFWHRTSMQSMITRTSGLHKLAWRGVLDLLFTHSDGEGAKEQVKVVGPRGDSGHTDLKHVSQHLLLQACSFSHCGIGQMLGHQ